VLEPNANPASQAYQASLREQGIPITAFFSDDLDRAIARPSDAAPRVAEEFYAECVFRMTECLRGSCVARRRACCF
jgi:hypothetical protein